MNLPSGLVFYLDFKYGTKQPNFETGVGKILKLTQFSVLLKLQVRESEGLYGEAVDLVTQLTRQNQQSIGVTDSDVLKSSSISNISDIDYDSEFSSSLTRKKLQTT